MTAETQRAPSRGMPTRPATSPLARLLLHPATKPTLFVLALVPLAWLVFGALADALGANPAERIIRSTGDWTLRLLCATLAVTPLRQLSGQAALARFRRMLGVFTFVYASLHLLSYAWLDKSGVLTDIAHDIAKRPFILVGFLTWTLMAPLAATSFNRAIRLLGAPRWQSLHRLIYLLAPLALLHFFWMRAGKHNFAEVIVYAAIVGALLAWRLIRRRRRQ